MCSEKVQILNSIGLTLRVAALFAQKATSFDSEITIEYEGKSIVAKSVLNIMAARILKGDYIVIKAEGVDEEVALKTLVDFVNSFVEDKL